MGAGAAGAGSAFVAGPVPVVRGGSATPPAPAPMTWPNILVISPVAPTPCGKIVTVVLSGTTTGLGKTGMFIVAGSSVCARRAPSVVSALAPPPCAGIKALAERYQVSTQAMTLRITNLLKDQL